MLSVFLANNFYLLTQESKESWFDIKEWMNGVNLETNGIRSRIKKPD
jgi:hypothetical protein